jgi:hypothetical protein
MTFELKKNKFIKVLNMKKSNILFQNLLIYVLFYSNVVFSKLLIINSK